MISTVKIVLYAAYQGLTTVQLQLSIIFQEF